MMPDWYSLQCSVISVLIDMFIRQMAEGQTEQTIYTQK